MISVFLSLLFGPGNPGGLEYWAGLEAASNSLDVMFQLSGGLLLLATPVVRSLVSRPVGFSMLYHVL